MPTSTRYIFVLGSVLSGLGKGIVTSAIGKNFQVRSKSICVVKIDPYLNVDAGLMSPFEHGECFVTDDGSELDVDFGHYHRFLETDLKGKQNITTGQIYLSVIQKERRGEYLGKTVQVVPHIIDEILLRIEEIKEEFEPEIMLIEVGGTIGDIESQPFLEAIRQLNRDRPDKDTMIVLLTYVPYPEHIQEHKTKPTQHGVRELRAAGLVPNMIICRSADPIDQKTLSKIAFFSDVRENAVLSLPDLDSVFEAPQLLDSQGLTNLMIKYLQLDLEMPDWSRMEEVLSRLENLRGTLTIGIPGKYTDLVDSYISVNEALQHAAWELGWDVELKHLSTEKFEKDHKTLSQLNDVDGVLVPGGFGDRGTEGKILAIEYARENNIPFLGICMGFQLAVVEYAKNIVGLEKASSTEINSNTPHPVVDLLDDQENIEEMGGTMRLGAYPIQLEEDSMVASLYESSEISERHRHRYEVNPDYLDQLQNEKFRFSGFYSGLAEILELKDHPFFVGVQFHPEFKSTPWNPSPPYMGLINAAIERNSRK